MQTEPAKRPPRVAMVHYRDSADAGGSLRVGETIANHVDPERVSVEFVFAYGGPGPVANRTKVPCHFIKAKGPKDFAAWCRARSLLKKLQPDLLHLQDGVVWLRAALAGTHYQTLLHVHARVAREKHGGERGRAHPFQASTLLRAYLKRTDAQVCINNGARNALLELGWIDAAKSCVVYNSIDVERFTHLSDRAESRTKLGLPQEALIVGLVCRLVWEKGCFDFLSIIERLPERWHGVICGDGPQKAELEDACRSRRLTDRVHFIGNQDDVVPVYASLDAYAFVSHYEPFGLVLAEAMAAGVPVFGIKGDGEFNEAAYPLLVNETSDLVSFARAGNYEAAVPSHIFDEVAARISNYGEHPAAYRGMISRARTWVGACFDASIQAEAMTRVYEDMYARHRPSPVDLTKFYEAKLTHAEALMVNSFASNLVAATA